MMSLTHVTIGMAVALLSPTETPTDIVFALAGGALGGVLADIDTVSSNKTRDAWIGESMAVLALFFAALFDLFSGKMVWNNIVENKEVAIIGLIAFIILLVIGFHCNHRDFTHSLLAMMLFTSSLSLIYLQFAIVVLVSYFSHLVLDLLNKRGIQLFFPFQRHYCLKVCYANGKANTVITIIGFIATLVFLMLSIEHLPS